MKITILNYSVIIGSLENSLATQALQNIGLKSIKVSSINLNYVLGVRSIANDIATMVY